MNNTIQYAVDNDGIAILTIDLPGKSMNVLSRAAFDDVETLVYRYMPDPVPAVGQSLVRIVLGGADQWHDWL